MSTRIYCDLAIIGGGSGGLSLASGAAQMGANVVLVEGGKMGGDCLNYGCVPSKSLLSAAKAMWQAKQKAAYFGVQCDALTLDMSKVMQHVHGVIGTIAKHDSVERFEKLGVNVIQAQGKFIDKKTLEAGEYHVCAKRFVIATGSSPFVPTISGLDAVNYHTNETIFELRELPEHLIVMGGGPIGIELGQAFAMLGAKVTILQHSKILSRDDPDCVDIIKKQLEEMGVDVREHVEIEAVSEKDGGITVQASQAGQSLELTGSHLLVATGRRANVEALQLEAADVAYTPRGVKVDARLRSTNKKIYAIGDAAGAFQFTHVANYHAGIVLRNVLFKLPAKVDYRAVPWVAYTLPELAHVGLRLEEARKKHGKVQLIEWPYSENDRALAEHESQGKIKVIADKKGRVLGVTIVGVHAGDLLLPWIMAIREGKTLRAFTDTIVPYPTLAELSKQVAGRFYAPMLFSDRMRSIVRFLQKLG